MSVAVSLSALVLAAVFAVAGVAKLADLAGTRRAIGEFGAPARLVPTLAVALPLAELGIAAALIPPGSARWAAIAALAMLLVFCAAIVRALARGSAPDCNCFGGLTQTTIGRGTLVRNVALAAVAAFAAFGSRAQAGALGWLDQVAPHDRLAVVVIAVLAAVVVGLCWFCWQLLRQNGRLLLRLDAQAEELGAGGAMADAGSPFPGLEPGEAAPAFAHEDLDGEPVSLESLLLPGNPVVLLFSDTNCGACEKALGEAARTQKERTGEVTVSVVSRGDAARIREQAHELGLGHVIHDPEGSLFDAFRMRAAPAAQVIDATGRIASARMVGAEAASELITAAGAYVLLSPAAELTER